MVFLLYESVFYQKMLPLILLCSVILTAAEELQMSTGEGGTQDQEVAFLITSPIFVRDDPKSKSFVSMENVELVRPNETITFVRGEFQLMKEVDDLTKIEVVLKKNHMTMWTMDIDICKELSLGEEGDYYGLMKYFLLPPTCPIDPGKYTINELKVNLDDLPVNSGNIGDYEAAINVKRCTDKNCNQNMFLAGLMLTCVIEPV